MDKLDKAMLNREALKSRSMLKPIRDSLSGNVKLPQRAVITMVMKSMTAM